MLNWKLIALFAVCVAAAFVVFKHYQWMELFQSRLIIPKFMPAVKESTLETKIPKRVIRSFATNEVSGLFAECVTSMYEMNPEYEHHFFTDADCDTFMRTEYAGRVADAYDKLVPGAYRSDLFRICYLYKHGGVYVDLNKTMLMPLSKVLNGNYDLVTTIDRPTCCVWQAFLACKPGLPVFALCIEQCVQNVEQEFYGAGPLDITGPMMMGRVFRNYYGECVKHPGVYRKRGELVKLLVNDGRYNRDEFGRKVLNLNFYKRLHMDADFKKRNNLPHYTALYKARQVYRQEPMDFSF